MSILNKKGIKIIVLQCISGIFEKFLRIVLMYYIARMTDFVVSGNANAFIRMIPFITIVLCIQILMFYITMYLGIQCQAVCGYEIRNRIYTTYLYSFQQKEKDIKKSSILNIYNTQMEQLQNYVSQFANIGISIITSMLAICFMVHISLKLLLVSLIFIPISSYAYQLFTKPLREKNREILKEKENLNHIVKEALNGFYIVKSYLLRNFFYDRFRVCSDTMKKKEKEKDQINSVLGRMGILLRYLPQLIIPLYGGWLCFGGDLSIGNLVAANRVIWYVILPIETLLSIRKNKREMEPILENIKLVLHRKQERENNACILKEKDTQKMVEIRNLKFSYDQKTSILNNLNLQMHKGEHVVLTGESGIGKSTIARILCGLEVDYDGEVYIDGVKAEADNILELRKKISYVPQEPYIFKSSIKDNICMGKKVSLKQIYDAAKMADAHPFIMSFPMGYDTVVGEGGIQLSGGQKKRIALARGIISGGSFFILDEPMSALEKKSMARILQGIMAVWQDKTVLVISHKPSEILNIDRIYKMEGGQLSAE